MNDPVSNVIGIGKVTTAALKQLGITTVKQLAEADPDQLHTIINKAALINRAKLYLDTETAAAPPPPAPIVLGAFGKPAPVKEEKTVTAEPDGPTASDTSTEPDRYLISDHSWHEQKILLPRSVWGKELTESDLDEKQETCLRDGIIYELSIEPHNRVSFVCSWLSVGLEGGSPADEVLCTMTFSPQLLLHFNLHLPPFKISILPKDWEALPNPEVIKNVLWEISVMQKLSADVDDE